MTSLNGGQADRPAMDAQEEVAIRSMVLGFPSLCLSVSGPDGSAVVSFYGEDYARASGYRVQELESEPDIWMSVVHPSDSGRLKEAYRRLAAGEQMHERYRIYRKDGQMRHVVETGTAGKGRWRLRSLLDTSVRPDIAFEQLVDETPIGISVRDLSGRILYCNPAYATALGYDSPDEMIGTDFGDIMSPAVAQEFQEQAFPAILRGPWSGEAVVTRKDGSERRVRVSADVFRDSRGKPFAAHAAVLDVTELRETERALIESRELLQSVQNALPASIAAMDADGNIIAVNERWKQFAMENGDPELTHTCEGVNYLDVCRRAAGPMSEGADVALAGLEAILSGALPELEMEYPCPSPSHSRWFFMRASPLTGQRRGAVVAHIDISRRKRAEDALRDSEARYHSLLENQDAMVFRVGADLSLIALAGRVRGMLGYDPEELLADPALWLSLLHPDDRAKARETMTRTREDHLSRWLELRLRHRSGRIVWIRGTLTPIYDDRGELLWFDGVSLDVTERVAAQERDARHSSRIRILADISQACGSTLDSRRIVDTTSQQLCMSLDCVAAGVTIEQASGRLLNLALCCPRGCDVKNLDKEIRQADLRVENVFGMMDVQARIVPDLSKSSPALGSFARRGGLKPGIIAPIITGEEVVGVILTARKEGEEFDEEDLWFVREVASHASAALANSTVYRRQARIAETLQRTLIPPEPSIGVLDIATLYAPAPGEARVGGDFFDVFRIDAKRVALVVGDVSGKGVEAAIHTAEAKYMLRAYAHQDPHPIHVVTELNSALVDYLPGESFITLAYFLIDVSNHSLSYANAGHETSLVLCRNEHRISDIGPGGPMLGVTSRLAYSDGEMDLYPDDLLFCYTDGIVDVRSNGDRYGFARLRERVSASEAEDARGLMEDVMGSVRAFGDAKQTDDQVVVVVRPLM